MPLRRLILFALCALSQPVVADAITMDGMLDPAYGNALVLQTTQTEATGGAQISGNSTTGDLNFSNGSELDGGFAIVEDGVLHLFLTGNLALMLNQNQNSTVRHVLDVFIDAIPGGQQTVNGLGAGVIVNGLTLDAGFEADFVLELEGDANGFSGPREWTARYGTIPTSGPGTFTTLGIGNAGGPGTLTGGSNPHGILVTIDNRNQAGVNGGCNASSGDGALRGIEWSIPLAALGGADGCIRITALVRSGSNVTNQLLGPAPVGTCPLGPISTLNLSTVAGDQFFEVCPVTGVPDRAGSLALALAGANPVRNGPFQVAVTLPDAGPARLALVDGAGRLVSERSVGGSAGRRVVDFTAGRSLAPGVYWLRLQHGAVERALKVAVLR